jgi:hypothetical protein
VLTTKCERKKEKMTKVEAYKAVIAGEITEEVKAKFEEMLTAHEAEGAKRRDKAAEKRAEKLEGEAALVDAIVEFLGDEFVTASDICEHFDEIKSAQKATILVKRAVEDGRAITEKVKGKSGKVNGYKRA